MRVIQKTSGIPKPLFLLKTYSERVLNDKKLQKWLWEHTKSPEHYDAVIGALRLLSQGFVDWED